ncbi:phage tail protein [Streptomyces sp. Lzd4kr]|nr:phage tail protein [Streptomyces sp. Lzd4kr]
MAGDDVTITIRANNGDAVRAFRDINGRLRDTRGRFVSDGAAMTGAMNRVAASIGGVRGSIIPLAAAAVPLAAAFAPIAAKAAGAGVAVAAFGAAVAGQVGSLTEAADAQDKYNDAVTKYGQGSKQAAEAQRAVQATFAAMPAATQRAAVSLGTLKDGFQDWSDSIADFTMAPVEKSFTVLGQLTPRLTDMAKGASTQLDRLVTVAGGAIATPGFDALSDKLSVFANESLKDAVDGVIHFARALSEGNGSGPIKTFMEYAEANGPALRETLANVGNAVMTLVEAASQAGPGMLTLVNAAAGLVASLPPELVATVMKLAVALKLVTLAGAGAAAIAGGVATLGARIAALQAASAAAGGGMAGLAAAFGTLGKAAKASIVVAGIGALVYAVSKLSDIGEKAPPNVDRLTTSLGKLGASGKVTGEAAKAFGEDFGKLRDQIDRVTDPSVAESVNNWGADVSNGILDAGDATEEFTKSMDSIDKSLTNLVQGGKAGLAKAALDEMLKGMSPEQAEKFTGSLDGYKSALADVAFEQELIVQSMGIFGEAAADTSAKLDAQKGAADGLRASILALNDVNRSAHDAQTQFEAAVDGLTESFKEHGATLNADTEAGRANRDAMSAASAAQDELIASGLAAGDSLASMTGKSEKLRGEMMRLATEAFDGNKQKATDYVNTLLGMPGEVKTLVKLEREQAIAGLGEVTEAIRRTPGAKTVTVETLNGAAIKALESVGLKTRQLPDGRTEVTTKNGQARAAIDAIRRALNALNGKTANTYTKHHYLNITENRTIYTGKGGRGPNAATGGLYTGKAFRYADGGPVIGPGTGTSDDVFAPWLSNGEFVIKAASVQKYGEKFLQMVNDGAIEMPRMARGGKVTKAERDARKAATGDLTISYFGKMAGYKTTEMAGELGRPDSVGDLVGALNKWRNVIRATTHGVQEAQLTRQLAVAGKSLLKQEKALEKVTKSLAAAREKLDGLKDAAASLKESVRSGIIGSANITRKQGDGPVTVASIMGGMQASYDKAKSFTGALAELKKRGVDKGLISEIAQAGVDGGGLETAGALLSASKSEIASLNKYRAGIVKQADAAGAITADAMYGAGIKAAEGLVKGLQSKEKSIQKAMLDLAKFMEKSIKKALGIKSPSTLMMKIGDHTAEGFAVGMRKNRSVQPAWTSMLNTPPLGHTQGRGAVVGVGGRPVIIHQTITLDGRVVAQQMFDPLRKEIAARGGSVQRTLGQGAG